MENNNQLQKTEKTLLTYLAKGITKEGMISVAEVDRIGIIEVLKPYKYANGSLNFGELIKIPSQNRIAAIAKQDLRGAVTTVSVALKLALETMNLRQTMNNSQVADCAEMIVDSAKEDNIAFEDLMLFLGKLTRGFYGNLYGEIDCVKVMSYFDKYRDERWQEAIQIRDKQHQAYKELGDPQIYEREVPKDGTPFGEQMAHYRNKVQIRNDEIRELRSEIKRKGGE